MQYLLLNLKKIFLIFTTFIFSIFSSFATAGIPLITDNSGTWWFNLGAGLGVIFDQHWHVIEDEHETDEAAAFGEISFNYATFNHQLLTLRATGGAQIYGGTNYLASSDEIHENLESVTEVGALYGLMLKNRFALASLSAGIAYVGANYETHEHADDGDDWFDHGTEINKKRHTISTVGLPFEAQLFLTPSRFFGIGLIGTANINDQVPFAGVMLGFQLGNLR